MHLQGLGFVDAAWVRSKHVAGHGKSARPGTSANVAKFAETAFSLETVRITQSPEDGRFAINLGQRLLADVSAGHRQKSAGIDVSNMGNEDKSLSIIHAGSRIRAPGWSVSRPNVGGARASNLLQDEPAIVLPFRCLNVKMHLLG